MSWFGHKGRRRKNIASIKRGKIEIRKFVHHWRDWVDLYHVILTLRWPHFFSLLIGYYFALNLLFAWAYWLFPGSVVRARAGSFLDFLFFSIETFTTVGYGDMSPGSFAGHVISSLEVLVGMMSFAILTGLTFARFSKPTARVLFSDKVVIGDHDGHRALMLRVANDRHNRIMEPTANLGLLRLEKRTEGDLHFRIHDLALEQKRNQLFALTWTLIHRIDETSPLYGWDKDALKAARSRISVSISGYDETIDASVHAFHEYSADQIVFDHRHADIISEGEDGTLIIDLTHFHDIVPSRRQDNPAFPEPKKLST